MEHQTMLISMMTVPSALIAMYLGLWHDPFFGGTQSWHAAQRSEGVDVRGSSHSRPNRSLTKISTNLKKGD
ncbi:MAG: hypothetical protein ACRYFU_09160 [Janthinobacterium lividum]